MAHTCHATGCNRPVPPKMLMCLRHWNMVPRHLQKQVWAAYRPGQEIDKDPSEVYMEAHVAAVRAVAQKEKELQEIALRPRFRSITTLEWLRTTSLRVYEQCKHTWATQYLSTGPVVEEERNRYSAIGTAAHLICEHHMYECAQHFDQLQQKYSAEEVQAAWLVMASAPEGEADKLSEYLATLADLCFDDGWVPIAQELEFTLPIIQNMPPIKGHVDCLLWNNRTNELLILDHKTNRRIDPLSYWQADIQPAIYSWAVRKLYPGYKLSFRLGYVNFDNLFHQWEAPAVDDDALVGRIGRIWASMVACEYAGEWPLTIGDGCKWCHMKDICPELKESTDNLEASFRSRVGVRSLGEQREWLKSVKKACESMLEENEKALCEAVREAGGAQQQGELVYSFKTTKTRRLAAFDCMTTLNEQWPSLSDTDKEVVSKLLEELLTVKVGGVDKLYKQLPQVGQALSARIKQVESAPSLDARAPGKVKAIEQ